MVVVGIGGWKDGGGYINETRTLLAVCSYHTVVSSEENKQSKLTISKPRPLKILSVVAATLPPFRCKSHIISRVFSCGNICDICSTWAGSTACPRARVRLPPAPGSSSRLKNHRITKKDTTAKVRREGILREGSSSDIVSSGS